MTRHTVFLLRIWRNTAISGRQWAARLDQLPNGPQWRFTTAAALVAHLHALVGDPAETGPAGQDAAAAGRAPQDEDDTSDADLG